MDDLRSHDLTALRRACDRAVSGHGPRSAADLLDAIPPDTATDRYGDGVVVAELEAELATVLGLPAAVYLPGGVMAEQAALRVHADRRGRRTVVYHPQSHLEVHEGRALERLQGAGRPPRRPPGPAAACRPGRRGRAPRRAARRAAPAGTRRGRAFGRGAPVGGLGRHGLTPAEIAGLFDTTYVSFYEGIGALAGGCLAGPADDVAEVREWRPRTGGTVSGLWPGAVSALTCLRRRLPLVPGYFQRAHDIAAAVRDLPRVGVVPDPTQSPLRHLLLRTGTEEFTRAVRRSPRAAGGPGSARCRRPIRLCCAWNFMSGTPRWRCPSTRSAPRWPRWPVCSPRSRTSTGACASTVWDGCFTWDDASS